MAEQACHLRLADLVVKGIASAQSSHIHLDAVASEFFGELEFS